MNTLCDCQSIRAAELPDALAVRASSIHVHRKLHASLHAFDVPFELHGDTFVITTSAASTLRGLLDTFSLNERADLHAAPHTDNRTDAWQSAPLHLWLHRLATPWFADVAKHLHFHLQPIVRLTSGEVYGYEALARGRLDSVELGAAVLLEAAAAHGQARAFDAHARRHAIGTAYPLLQPHELLFINFAPGVVYNPDICLQTTFQACRDVNADFSRLLFEVTESEAFPDLTLLKAILERYRAQGAKVALDDLGAGYTSLTFLETLRPDIVKLDRALIRGLHDADPRVDLVAALVRFAHELGVQVVIEGVETERELRFAQELGADFAQGYFLGRPTSRPAGLATPAAAFWSSVQA
ncbi:EAL domain-containing protein [Deinococcus yavapaiensis]|uniref:EAL domain-containing protein (Putative c-di-GMP-specific phosphodiesterase class I) n=1 Tax=Deinococcus yavapaiensis KR-236 TaxID=694435 RepID=A0A318S7Y8_9DEIO|nr:EAL domain-containing protein [Deinococcus yavapaiensis]PYE53848.1 EAL domain-containing protein (putative c-di-GMP-specific phosphodiesterase class I) [Deinococcus yavapaiensis KR-236]